MQLRLWSSARDGWQVVLQAGAPWRAARQVRQRLNPHPVGPFLAHRANPSQHMSRALSHRCSLSWCADSLSVSLTHRRRGECFSARARPTPSARDALDARFFRVFSRLLPNLSIDAQRCPNKARSPLACGTCVLVLTHDVTRSSHSLIFSHDFVVPSGGTAYVDLCCVVKKAERAHTRALCVSLCDLCSASGSSRRKEAKTRIQMTDE